MSAFRNEFEPIIHTLFGQSYKEYTENPASVQHCRVTIGGQKLDRPGMYGFPFSWRGEGDFYQRVFVSLHLRGFDRLEAFVELHQNIRATDIGSMAGAVEPFRIYIDIDPNPTTTLAETALRKHFYTWTKKNAPDIIAALIQPELNVVPYVDFPITDYDFCYGGRLC